MALRRWIVEARATHGVTGACTVDTDIVEARSKAQAARVNTASLEKAGFIKVKVRSVVMLDDTPTSIERHERHSDNH